MRKARITHEQKHIFRDACVFAFKLWLDGIKDFVLAVAGLVAAVVDIARGRGQQGFLFYRVMDLGHRLDRVIDVYGGHSPPGEREIEAVKEPHRGSSG